jgi:hypothetical protein
MLVTEKIWELLKRDSLLPKKSHPKHLLWTQYFLKVHSKQRPGCLAIAASSGTINPKTHLQMKRV